jgi:hypothetical protein
MKMIDIEKAIAKLQAELTTFNQQYISDAVGRNEVPLAGPWIRMWDIKKKLTEIGCCDDFDISITAKW